jgi:hypothetical protein
MGTSFYKEVSDEALYQHRAIWEQELVSENTEVYRAEYLAYQTYLESLQHTDSWSYETFLNDRTERDYGAGYLKGVHNTDAEAIYQAAYWRIVWNGGGRTINSPSSASTAPNATANVSASST